MSTSRHPQPQRRRRRAPGALVQIELLAAAALVGWAVPHHAPAVRDWLQANPAWGNQSWRWFAVIVAGTLLWTWNYIALRRFTRDSARDTVTDFGIAVAAITSVAGAIAALAGLVMLFVNAAASIW